MLMRFDPFRGFDPLSRLLQPPDAARPAAIPMDAYRDGDRFIVKFDLPGVDPSSIDLTVEKNVLTVRAERPPEVGEENEVLVQERPLGTFVRQLFLGEGLDAENVQANYDKGVLTLVIPVAEQAKPRKVQVTAESSGEEQSPTIKTDADAVSSAA